MSLYLEYFVGESYISDDDDVTNKYELLILGSVRSISPWFTPQCLRLTNFSLGPQIFFGLGGNFLPCAM